MRAIKKANGTTDIYFGLGPYCNLEGFLRWQGGNGFFPDVVPLGGTRPEPGAGESMVLEVAANNFASIGGKLLTSNDQVSGEWTPVINGVTDFGVRNASYLRVGKLVTIRAYIAFIGKTVPANSGVISGLPFMPKDLGACSVYRGGVSDPDVNAYIDPGNGTIRLNHPVTRNEVAFVSGADYIFSATFEIA